MRQLILLFLLCLAALACVATVSQLSADSAPQPRPRPQPEPKPAEKPKPEAPRAASVEIITDDFAGFVCERNKDGNFVFTLSFTVAMGNQYGEVDEIKRDDETRAIRVYATIKAKGDVGTAALEKRTVKPEFSNLKVGKYVVQLFLRKAESPYEPRAAWVIDAK